MKPLAHQDLPMGMVKSSLIYFLGHQREERGLNKFLTPKRWLIRHQECKVILSLRCFHNSYSCELSGSYLEYVYC